MRASCEPHGEADQLLSVAPVFATAGLLPAMLSVVTLAQYIAGRNDPRIMGESVGIKWEDCIVAVAALSHIAL